MPSSGGYSRPRDGTQVSCVAGGFFTISATREVREHWSGQPFPSPGDPPDPGVKAGSPALGWILHQLSHRGRLYTYIHIYMALIYYLAWQYLSAMWPGMQVELMCESDKTCSKMPSPC